MSKEEAKEAGLTYIAIIANFTEHEVKLENLENGNDESTSRTSLRRQFNLWFPWCESENDYKNNRKIRVTIGGANVFWMWERSGVLYYSRTDDFNSGAAITGDNKGDNYWKAFAYQLAADGTTYEMYVVNIKTD